ncbi:MULTISPECIES: glycosyltransferase family 9 protein [unclassified Caballeronia]|uniref:glycosyltransferase family 9 protein n=1 Tax=unclassified Caballeronia TaxID=2646786 RepID=UPI0020276ED6|nr:MULTISPECIES: glycosyltransferase family 9 protein [unclassified Caballeronia]MDR5765211.1 glycosyltransferase family 9 protein [Caballeronia sp. LZ028]
MIDSYQQFHSSLYAGEIEACFRFLDGRFAADGHTSEYLHARALAHLRGGEFLRAVDIGCELTRRSNTFGFQLHSLCDACAHLGLKEVALSMIEYVGCKPDVAPIFAFLWRVYGWHYLGCDDRVLELSPEGVDEHSAYVLGHHQGRSAMRLNGIASGVELLHRYWSSHEARRVLFPDVDIEHYWCGQRVLPAHLTMTSIASGHGDQVNWVRYAGALQALGVQIAYADGSDRNYRFAMPDAESARDAEAMREAGFAVATDGALWTDPFALFTALFPVLGYASSARYIEPADPCAADAIVDEIRQRAQGRRCVGIFWSSCESANNFASRSLALPDLVPLFDSTPDIHWVVMQRGFERKRWLNAPRSNDLDRFTTLASDVTLTQSVSIIDRLDAFVGNDGALSHIAGALGKPCYLFLNQVAEWRYERDPHVTPWYASMRLVRARGLGDWNDVVRNLQALLTAQAR